MARLPAEFRYEYQSELDQLSRRRFYVWAVCGLVFWVAALCLLAGRLVAAALNILPLDILAHLETGMPALKAVLSGVVLMAGLAYARRRTIGHQQVLQITFWTLVTVAAISATVDVTRRWFVETNIGFLAMWSSHLFACLILPLSARQAVRPALAMLLLWMVASVINPAETGLVAFPSGALIFNALTFVPGLIVCAIRTSAFGRQFEKRMLEHSYSMFSHELFDARRIHEALFPDPIEDGSFRMGFKQRPRAGIGGDLLHACLQPVAANDDGQPARDRLHLVVLDVGGDGIAAALTVNRYFGEIERLYAEHPDLNPAEFINRLNRYSALTMAPIGVYAVAMCIHLDTDGTMRWSGAGHAPALIRRADGTVEEVPSTTWPLGASKEADPENQSRSTTLQAGETLLMYTDGACDYPDADGSRLGYHGLRKLISRVPMGQAALRWPDTFLGLIDQHRETYPENPHEDILIVAVELAAERSLKTPGRYDTVTDGLAIGSGDDRTPVTVSDTESVAVEPRTSFERKEEP
ncbi:MAG: serine/threonine-protein phosphatase [Planctomycetes bacterium]|nr:serine/threonine-protein phosphatase [Planctomycetota bacterium]